MSEKDMKKFDYLLKSITERKEIEGELSKDIETNELTEEEDA